MPGRSIHLTSQETKILAVLMYPPGDWVGENEFISAIYENPEDEPEDAKGVIDQHIFRLRRKLEGTGVVIYNGVQRGKHIELP